MKGLVGGPIIIGDQNTVRQIQIRIMEKPRLKGLFLVFDTRRGGVQIVGRFVRLESSGEIMEAY